MSIFNRMFRRDKPSSLTPAKNDYNQDFFKSLVGKHIERMKSKWPTISQFIDDYFTIEQIEALSLMAMDKYNLAITDKRDHTAVLAKTPVEYAVTFFPVNIDVVKDWCVDGYGGYMMLLEDIANHDMVSLFSCSILCHLVFCFDNSSIRIGMAITPIAKNPPIQALILPHEYLTKEESNKAGV